MAMMITDCVVVNGISSSETKREWMMKLNWDMNHGAAVHDYMQHQQPLPFLMHLHEICTHTKGDNGSHTMFIEAHLLYERALFDILNAHIVFRRPSHFCCKATANYPNAKPK